MQVTALDIFIIFPQKHILWFLIRLILLQFNNSSTLVDPERGRKEIEEIAEEMKEKDREERGKGMKGKKQKK